MTNAANASSTQTFTGGCLCGGVRFDIDLAERSFGVCHCGTCRKWSAGPFMAAHSERPIRITADKTLTWWKSSEFAERGFCGACGTSLFYRLSAQPDAIYVVSVEALDDPSGFRLTREIYVDSQPDRYAFAGERARMTEAEFLAMLGITPA